MGQYYQTILKDKEGKFYCYEADWIKLTEHSWFFNPTMNAVAKKMLKKPMYVAEVGDYADEDDFNYNKEFVEKYGHIKETTVKNCNFNLFGYFLINHTKKEFLNVTKYVMNYAKNSKETDADNLIWIIHPLPLLTAIGNGKGGGDYRGTNMEYVGIWACDLIEVSDEMPNRCEYKEILPFFEE